MLKSQTLTLELSELREVVNGLLAKDQLTDEERSTLDSKANRLRDAETEFRAALTVEAAEADRLATLAGDDPETAELRSIQGRTKVSSYLAAAMETRAVNGAEAEFNAALGMDVTRFPLRLLAPVSTPVLTVEERATTGANAQSNQQRWLDRLFADTAAMRIGITFDSVGPGQASYPVTTAGATAAQRGKEQTTADAAWTVGVTELDPTRAAVRAIFTIEDAARLPSLEDSLTRDLRMALAEGVDRSIFVGDSTANPNTGGITGLQTAASVVEQEITQANKVSGSGTLAAFAALIDGQHATSAGELRTVAAVGANTLWLQTVINATADNQTLAQFLMASGINWSVRGGIEDDTANGDFGAFIGRARGIEGAAVAPVWDSGQLIRDPYSNAADGEVALTLSYRWNFGLPRASNFARIKFVT